MDGVWKIKGMDCIYERDMLIPVVPDPKAFVDPSEFEKYRKSYKCVSWLFNHTGLPCGDELPGDDKPETVQKVYDEVSECFFAEVRETYHFPSEIQKIENKLENGATTMTEKLIPQLKPRSPEEQAKRMEEIKYAETHNYPAFEQAIPVDAASIYREFTEDYDAAEAKYARRRIEVTGVVRRIGPDPHGLPSIELSDSVDGRCCALVIFTEEKHAREIEEKTAVGETVVCLANFLSAMEPYGAVMKKSEIIARAPISPEEHLPAQKPIPPEARANSREELKYSETHDRPAIKQDAPFAVKDFFREFMKDYNAASEKYHNHRVEVTGVVRKICPDLWDVPSIELSDRVDGRCYALVIFTEEEHAKTIDEKTAVGETVICRANFIRAREPYGAVMKKSEIIK